MTEIEKLINLLTTHNIPYEITENLGTPQVWYPSRDNCVCDVICHRYCYGYAQGLLEMMGLVNEEEIGDSVEGYLTAKDIFDRIYADHFGTTKENK